MRGKTISSLLFLMLLCFAVGTAGVVGGEAKEGEGAAAEKKDDEVPEKGEKKLSVVIGGKSIAYTVKTGMTAILDGDDGEKKADLFSTSYIMDGGERERPVMFLFNGGPGSASVYLHCGSFAPVYFPGKNLGLEMAEPPYKLEANPHSLLDVADLVFVDPAGTGFSRMAEKKKDEKAASGDDAFWSVTGDIESMVEFIRMWLIDNDRWGAEIYLAGESYGGLRAAGMAGSLDDIGVALSGVVLISPAISYADISRGMDNDITPYANALPSMAAVAHYHKRLGGELRGLSRDEVVERAIRWVEERYVPGLRAGNRLSGEERAALVREMSEFTGLPVVEIEARNMRFEVRDFSAYLLRDEGKFLGLYDGRLTAPGYVWGMDEDPTSNVAGEPYKTAFMRFLTETVGIRPKRGYVYTSLDVNKVWDFSLGLKGRAGHPGTGALLAQAMRRLPFMRVFLAMGRYDLITPAESALRGLSRMEVPAERLDRNVTKRIYEGGHMMYSNPEELERLSDDLRAWVTHKR